MTKSSVQSFLTKIGFGGSPQQRAFDKLISAGNYKKARSSFPNLYKKWKESQKTKNKKTDNKDYRKGGMVLSTTDNRKKK